MKKIIGIVAAALALALIASCGAGGAGGFKVGLVTDVGGIDDKSFNQGTWEGIKKFAEENKMKVGKQVKFLQSTAEADYVPNLSTFADEGMSLIIAPGFLFEKSITDVSAKFPKVNFLIIDSVVAGKPNVASAVFAEHEGSYLVGVAVGLKAKADGKNKDGFLGGMQFPLIQKFEAGFVQGVKAVYPECQIMIDYAGAFDKPAVGQAIAQKQFNAGAYVIFHAAGATGNGMIKEAKERAAKGEAVWAVGVDKDQYADGVYADGKSAVLTSMVKRVDVASHDVSAMAKEGKFPGGQVIVFNLANKGVGLPADNPNLSADIVSEADAYAEKIVAGEIVVSEMPGK